MKKISNKISKSKIDFLSVIAHYLLNIGLAISVWFSIKYIDSVLLGIIIILVSKWRVFAVKKRYWSANIKSNLVDFVVGIGYVIIISRVGIDNTISQALLTLLYIIWLILLKPRSTNSSIFVQGVVANIVGFAALFSIAYNIPSVTATIIAFIIGYTSFYHLNQNYSRKDSESELFYLFWGFISSVVFWIINNWSMAYFVKFGSFYPFGNFKFSEGAIIISIMFMITSLLFDRYINDQDNLSDTQPELETSEKGIKANYDVLIPVAIGILTISLLVLFFSNPIAGL